MVDRKIYHLLFTFTTLILTIVVVVSDTHSQNNNQLSSSFDNRSPRKQPSFKRYNKSGCSNNYKFDYLNINLQWGPGYCRTSPQACDTSPKQDFTIHGFWPNLWSSKRIENCCFNNVFRIEELAPIMNDMNNYWPSLHGKASSFWSHEWLKHGTCARDVAQLRGELNYFQTTLSIFKSFQQILEKLAQSNIRPGNEPIKAENMIEALKQLNNGKLAQIGCDYEHHHSTPILTHLSFCFDSNLQSIDCKPTSSRCSKTLLMPDTYFINSPLTFANLLSSIRNRISFLP